MRVVLLLATPLALERQHGQICPVALVPASHLLAQHLRLLVEVRVVAWHILHRVHVLVDCCPCRAQLCFELEAALLVVRTTALYLSPKLGLVQRRPWRASARARARIGRLRWHRAHAPGLHRATCLESARCGWDPPTSRSVLAHVCSLLLPCLAYAFSVASRLPCLVLRACVLLDLDSSVRVRTLGVYLLLSRSAVDKIIIKNKFQPPSPPRPRYTIHRR